MSEIYKYFLTDKYIKPIRLTDKYMRNLRLRIVYCYGKIELKEYCFNVLLVEEEVGGVLKTIKCKAEKLRLLVLFVHHLLRVKRLFKSSLLKKYIVIVCIS